MALLQRKQFELIRKLFFPQKHKEMRFQRVYATYILRQTLDQTAMSHGLNAQQMDNLPHCHVLFGHLTDAGDITLTWNQTHGHTAKYSSYLINYLGKFDKQTVPVMTMSRYSISSVRRFHCIFSSCKASLLSSLSRAFKSYTSEWSLEYCLPGLFLNNSH